MYDGPESIDKDLEKIGESIKEIETYKGRLSESKEIFYKVLKMMEDTSRRISHNYVYTNMKHHEDTRINENQAKATKAEMMSNDFSRATSYIVPEIISMDPDTLDSYMRDDKIAHYKKMVDEILRDKPHTLSQKEEEILAQVGELTSVPETTYEMLSYADMVFPEIEDEDGNKVRVDPVSYTHLTLPTTERV